MNEVSSIICITAYFALFCDSLSQSCKISITLEPHFNNLWYKRLINTPIYQTKRGNSLIFPKCSTLNIE